MNKGLRYFLLLIVPLTILACVSWQIFPSKSIPKVKIKIDYKKIIEQKKRQFDIEINYSHKLTDKVRHYLEESYLNGTRKFLKRKRDIFKLVTKGELKQISESEYYFVDSMRYSYPFLTPSAAKLLDEIGRRFQDKLEFTSFECARFNVTSMLRTTSSVARLRKWNRTSIKNSSHLHGTSFDISHTTFYHNRELTIAECNYLAEVLAKIIWELRNEGKCFATFEYWQRCFHVVSR